MKKVILSISILALSVVVYAQNVPMTTQPVTESSTTVKIQPQPTSKSNTHQSTPTPAPAPTPAPKSAPEKSKSTQNQPIANPPAQSDPMRTPKPANSGDYDNGQHKNKGKHKGEIKHDHKKNDKDTVKVKKVEN